MRYEYEETEDERWERLHEARLRRNPDCRDPAHPGCEWCWERDEEPEKEAEGEDD